MSKNVLPSVGDKKNHDVQKSTAITKNFLSLYYSLDRPNSFQSIIPNIIPHYRNSLVECDLNALIERASLMYLSAYRLSDWSLADQIRVHDQVLDPYVNVLTDLMPAPLLIDTYTPHDKSILFVVQHAIEEGGVYAPAAYMMPLIRHMTECGFTCSVFVIGEVSRSFISFGEVHENMQIFKIKNNSSFINDARAIKQIIEQHKPAVVCTEVPVGSISAISVINPWIPIYYHSAGPFVLPYYSRLLKMDVLGPAKRDREYRISNSYPLSSMLQVANTDKVSEYKTLIDYSDQDIVFGYYGQLAKFTDSYLKLVIDLLAMNSNAKFVCAGSGNPNHIEGPLAELIEGGRVFVLSHSHVPSLLKLYSFCIETFPEISGSAAIEAMLHGVPVFSVSQGLKLNEYFKFTRLPEFIFEDTFSLTSVLGERLNDRSILIDEGKVCQKFATDLCLNSEKSMIEDYLSLLRMDFGWQV